VAVGRTAEEMEKVEVAVLQARAAYDAHPPPPPPPPPPLAMEMLSEDEMATALRRSEEDTVDTNRHQWLVVKLEEEGKKRLELALVDASQVAAASIGEGALDSVATPGGEADEVPRAWVLRQSYGVYCCLTLHTRSALRRSLRRT